MANTQLSDVFVPQTFRSYQIEDPIISSAFFQSGLMSANAMLNEAAGGSGFLTTIPFWKQIDSSIEPNYSNDVYTDIADTQKVGAGTQIVRIADLNEGFSSMDLVEALAGEDPLKFVAAHIDQFWVEQMQRRLIAIAIGLYNDNVAANAGDMVVDVSDALAAVDAANQIGSGAFINAALTMGDRMKEITAIAMHSVIFGTLAKADQIIYVKPSSGTIEIPTYLGKTVIIDDGMPIVGGNGTTIAWKYLCVLFGRGSIGYGRGRPKVPSEFQRAPERGNGGGVETLWSRKRWAIHPFGYDFTSATITGPGLSPTWADLKLATNWTRKLSRKNVPMAFLVVNA